MGVNKEGEAERGTRGGMRERINRNKGCIKRGGTLIIGEVIKKEKEK